MSDGFLFAQRSLPLSIKTRISVVANQKFKIFEGTYHSSEKVPDLAVKITNDEGVTDVKFVLEVGLSESYEKLVADANSVPNRPVRPSLGEDGTD